MSLVHSRINLVPWESLGIQDTDYFGSFPVFPSYLVATAFLPFVNNITSLFSVFTMPSAKHFNVFSFSPQKNLMRSVLLLTPSFR